MYRRLFVFVNPFHARHVREYSTIPFPGYALHEKGLQRQMGIGTLVSNQERRAAVVPRINHWPTAGQGGTEAESCAQGTPSPLCTISGTTKEAVLDYASETQTHQILCKRNYRGPRKPIDDRLIRGTMAALPPLLLTSGRLSVSVHCFDT